MREHGTINRYANGKCRCWACTEANRDYLRAYRARRKQPGYTPRRYVARGPEVVRSG